MHLGSKTGLKYLGDRIAVVLLVVMAPACTGMFTPVTTLATPSGPLTAVLGDPDEFPRFRMPDHGEPLAASTVADDTDLLILERDGHARALLVSEMSWHHVAEGTLAGRPIAAVY